MPLIVDDLVTIESESRLYTLHCAVCGKSGMTEPVTTHELACHDCGNNTLRSIRNKDLEKNFIAFMAGGKLND